MNLDKLVEVPYDRLIHETEHAWFLSIDGRRIWFHRGDNHIDKGRRIVIIPESRAKEEGLEHPR